MYSDKLDITSRKLAFALISAVCWTQSCYALEGKSFQGIPFIRIEPGCFQMGNERTPTERTSNESPRHKVCLSKAFYIGETEVTQKQWESIMGSNPSKTKSFDKPVNRVSWDDAQQFIKRLNEKDGGNAFRLPTEAEWEFAARAGTDTDYFFGDNASSLAQYAWFGNLGYKGSVHEVAQKQPNPWGLYDIHGNVWEWVQDWYSPNFYSDSPENDPKGPETGKYRTYRGGSFIGKASEMRVTVRYSALPSTRTQDVGLRLVRDID